MPDIPRSPSHLFLRNNTYYFRLAIPMHLRDIVRQREIRMSLGTSYLYHARRLANRMHVAGLQFFQEIERMKDSISEQKLKELKSHFFHQQIELEEALRLKLPHRSLNTLQQAQGNLEKLKEELRLELASGQLMTGKAKLIKHLVRNDLDPALDGVSDKKLYQEITKALADAVEVMLHRKDGDFNFEDTIMAKYDIRQEQQPVLQAVRQDEAPRKSMLLSVLIKKHCDNRIAAGKWKKKNLGTMTGRLNWLPFIVGDIDVSTIDYALMEGFRNTLLKMPKNRTKAKAYRDKTVDEILAMKVETPLAEGTINDIIGAVSSMFGYAIKLDVMDRNFADGLQVKEEKSDDEKRLPFTLDDLQTIFHPKGNIDRFFRQEERFWVTVISLLQGMRLEEVAQLHMDDVYEEGGHVVIDINDKQEKSVKNPYSRRVLPIHPVLRDVLNFPDFVARMRRKKAKRLFPNLKQTESGERYGNAVSAWFSRELIKNGIKVETPEKTFHSLRHTFIGVADCLDGLEEKHIVGVTGHSRQKKTKKDKIHPSYVKKFPSDFLYDKVLSQIGDFGVDWEKLAESKFVVKK